MQVALSFNIFKINRKISVIQQFLVCPQRLSVLNGILFMMELMCVGGCGWLCGCVPDQGKTIKSRSEDVN